MRARVCQHFEVCQHEFANLSLPCEGRFTLIYGRIYVKNEKGKPNEKQNITFFHVSRKARKNDQSLRFVENARSPSASIPLRHITVTLLPRQHVSFRLAVVSDAAVIWVITLRDERFLGHAAIRSFGSDQLVVKL